MGDLPKGVTKHKLRITAVKSLCLRSIYKSMANVSSPAQFVPSTFQTLWFGLL